MDQCDISPKSDNASIYFPLTIQAESADPTAVIYLGDFKCYLQRAILTLYSRDSSTPPVLIQPNGKC